MRDPLYVWFESELGMMAWPDAALPADWPRGGGGEGESVRTHGRVVVSLAPAGAGGPHWQPSLIGPVEIAHGETAARSVAEALRELGHVVFAAGGSLRIGAADIGTVRYPVGMEVYCRQAIYGVRRLPLGIPNHSGRAIQVLVSAVGGLAWINVLPEDVELSK